MKWEKGRKWEKMKWEKGRHGSLTGGEVWDNPLPCSSYRPPGDKLLRSGFRTDRQILVVLGSSDVYHKNLPGFIFQQSQMGQEELGLALRAEGV